MEKNNILNDNTFTNYFQKIVNNSNNSNNTNNSKSTNINYKEIKISNNIKYIGFFYENNNPNLEHPILPLKLCIPSKIKFINSDNIINKLILIQKNHAKIKYKIGFSKCRICNNNNKCNEYYLDYYVWPAGYIHYLIDHNIEIDSEFKKYIEDFDLDSKHFSDFDYSYN